MKQTLKLIPGYNYPPLFNNEGEILPERLSLSKNIINKMHELTQLCNIGIDLNNPLEGGYKGQDVDIYNKGKEIYLELSNEIGDEYDVLYWSNLENKFLSKKDIIN